MAMSSPFLKELYSLPKHDKANSGNIIWFFFLRADGQRD